MKKDSPLLTALRALPPPFHRRSVCLAALGMLGGLFCFWAGGLSRSVPVLAVLVLMAVAARFLERRALLPLVFAVLAMCSAMLQCPAAVQPCTGELRAVVAEEPETYKNRTVLTLRSMTLNGVPLNGRGELTVSGALPKAACDSVLTAYVTVTEQEESKLYRHRAEGVSLTGTCAPGSVTLRPGEPSLHGRLLSLRAAVRERILALFPENGELACGILLGSRVAKIDAQTKEQFRSAGISHLLAVSGLHVGILAGALLWLLRPVRSFRLRLALMALLLFGYAALTAFSPSVLRASLMVLLPLPAVSLRRRADSVSSLCFAAVIILLINPFALWELSFQLSFSAVLGLILLSPLFAEGLRPLGRTLSSSLSASLGAILATLPVSVAAFGYVSLTGLLTNLPALMAVPFFVIPGAAVTLLSLICLPLAKALARLPGFVLAFLKWLASVSGSLELALPAPGLAAMLLFYLSLLFFSRLCLWEKRQRLEAGAGLLLLSAAAWALL